jgi:hypothetical protein
MGVSRYTRPFPWYTNAKPLLAEHDPGMFQSLLARWLEFEDVEFSYGIQLASGGLVQYGAALDASSVPIAAMPEYQMRFVDRLRAVQQKGHGKKLRVRRPGELAIYASKPGVRSNYGHFLIETLPALLDLTRHPPAGHDGVWFLIDQPASAVLAERCQELIGLIGILPQSVHSVRKPTRVDAPLGVIFNYSVHPYSKAAPPLQALRARLRSTLSHGERTGAVVLSRGPEDRRSGDALGLVVEEVVAAVGSVTTIDCTTAPATEQLAATAQASLVVGVMGANMANIIAAPPHTPVLFLAPQRMPGFFYWDLCAVLHLPYLEVRAPPASGLHRPLREQMHSPLCSMDRGAVRRALQCAMSGGFGPAGEAVRPGHAAALRTAPTSEEQTSATGRFDKAQYGGVAE